MRLDGTNVVRHCKVLGSGVLILCTAWPGSVGARRVQPRPKVTVTVSKSGSGTGQVVSQPPGIDCGMDCIGEYPQDTELEITAQPSPDSTFDGWSGPCSGTEPCVVRVRAATQIEAKFSVRPPPPKTPVPSPTDAGRGAVQADGPPASIAVQAPSPTEARALRQLRVGHNLIIAGDVISIVGDVGSGAGLFINLANGFLGDPTAQTVGVAFSYAGAGVDALGFGLTASGYGVLHSAAQRLGRDPGRGLFAAGTTVGALAFASLGASIFLLSTNYYTDPIRSGNIYSVNGVAVLSCLAGSGLLFAVSQTLYNYDHHRLAQALKGVYSF